MILIDAFAWLLIAKIAILLFDDLASAARGKRSPRLRARDERRATETNNPPAPSGWWGRTTAAAGGYVAGLVEDGATKARASRRTRAARKRGQRAVDGILIDLDDHDNAFYADCDVCGWSSRPFRIEANAKLAGAEHALTHKREEDEREGEEPKPTADGPRPQPTRRSGPVPRPRQAPHEPAPRPWTPTIIPGGAGDPPADGCQSTVVHPGPSPYTLPKTGTYGWMCPRCHERREGYTTEAQCRTDGENHSCAVWNCPRCGAQGAGFKTEAEALAAGKDHTCPTTDVPAPSPTPQEFATTDEDIERVRRDSDTVALNAFEMFRRCRYPMPERPHGMCGAPNFELGDLIGNQYCSEHTDLDAYLAQPTSTTSTTTTKENTVNTEATGPEEIRNAFQTAIETSSERSEEIGTIAGVLGEVADRYESLKMAASTVAHIRDAAEAFSAAESSLQTASEELEAALADFNAHDGAVGEVVADTGGNVASEEVLVG